MLAPVSVGSAKPVQVAEGADAGLGDGTVPRGLLLARAWARLGDSVAPLTNASGRPLARTVKLILDPLVLRPVWNPRFAGGAVRGAHADELVATIIAAGPALAATAEWFLLVKKARRRAGVTEGNPQDLYFQRCFELASAHGDPRANPADAAGVADAVVAEIHSPDARPTVDQLRRFVTDPRHADELASLLRAAWQEAATETVPDAGPSPDPRVAGFLATCATAPDATALTALVSDLAGTRAAAELGRPGVALGYGLTDRERLEPPALGDRASKRHLPKPLDRSILERLFARFTTVVQGGSADLPAIVRLEILRSARPWQLAEEVSRVTMVLGRDASAGLGDEAPTVAPTGARGRLRSRWEREAYVHRVLRLPAADAAGVPGELRADIRTVRRAYLRRLWVRLHGRELRGTAVTAGELWDLLDGVLRSVIMDQRDRLRSALERRDSGEAGR